MTQEEAKNYVATQVYDNNNKEVKAGNVRNSVNKAIDYTKEIEDKVATIGTKVDGLPHTTNIDGSTLASGLADENGNVALGIDKNGNILSKNFDSSKTTKITDLSQLNLAYAVGDANGNIVIAVDIYGNVYAKNFNSAQSQESSFWNGKKVVWNGDSISYGSQLSDITKAYPYLVASQLGMTLKNYAIGGTIIAKGAKTTYQNTEGGKDYDEVFLVKSEWETAKASGTLDTSKKYLVKDEITTDRPYGIYHYTSGNWAKYGNTSTQCGRTPLVDRIAEMDKDADLVVIACGTNDFFYMWSSFGTMESTDKTSFYGATKSVCEYLITNYKNKQIVFVNCIKRYQPTGKSNAQWTEEKPLQKNPNGQTMEDYNNALKEICGYYSIPCVDMYAISGLNPYYDASLFADTDGKHVHPNVEGHKRMASYMVAFLNSLRN